MLKAVAACRLFTGLKSDWTRLGGWRQVEALDDERPETDSEKCGMTDAVCKGGF